MAISAMENELNAVADCYADGERAEMIRFQRLRAVLLAPVLKVLNKLHITANHITLLSFLTGMCFCAFWWQFQVWAMFCLLLHVLLDGLDGPVARHQGTASARGSLTDSMCDQLVVTASMICLMVSEHVTIISGAIYIFTYAMVVAFAMIRNALERPYSWLLRPRFFVYILLAADVFWLRELGWNYSLEYLLWGCNLVLSVKMASGFFAIRRAI